MPIYLIDKIQQKNGKDFFLVDAEDIECKDGTSLQDKLDALEENINSGGGSGGGSGDSGSDSGPRDEFVNIFESALSQSQ